MSDGLVLCLSGNHIFNMLRMVRIPVYLSRQNNVQFSWSVNKPRPDCKEPQSFSHGLLEVQWKTSLIQLSAEMNIREINLLIEKINRRALSILFFLQKYHIILKVEVKCLKKRKF